MEIVRLEEICELITDGTHQTPTYSKEGYIFLSSKNVTSRKIDWQNIKYISEELHRELIKRVIPKKNDILLAKNGTTGVGAIVDKEIEFDIYVSLALLRPNDKVLPRYLFWAVNSPAAKRKFDASLKGIGVKNLHLSAIKKIEINIYNKETQEKIIKVLDKLQKILEERQKLLENLDLLSKCLFEVEFLNKSYYKYPLCECTTFIDYRGRTPQISSEGTIQMINAKSVGKNNFKYIDEFVTEEIYNLCMTRGLGEAGDILFVTEGHTFGNVCIIPENLKKFALGQRVITIRGKKEQILNKYLCYYMQTEEFKKDINMYKTGGTAQGIRSKDLGKIIIPIPELKLQNQFAERVKLIEKSKFSLLKFLKAQDLRIFKVEL